MTGRGVLGTVAGRAVAVGNAALLESLRVPPGTLAPEAERLRSEGATAMFVAMPADVTIPYGRTPRAVLHLIRGTRGTARIRSAVCVRRPVAQWRSCDVG